MLVERLMLYGCMALWLCGFMVCGFMGDLLNY